LRHNATVKTGLPSRPRRRFPGSRPCGFTLIEIAIVLVIAALIVAAGVGISVSMIDNARTRATRQNMESVKLALQNFLARNGRLPCPAVETLGSANAQYGLEDTAVALTPATSCTNTVNLPKTTSGDAAKRGVVPWKTLGLTAEGARDGWGNQITYMVSVTPTTVNFDTVSGIRGSLYVHSATAVAAGLPATGNQINACSTTADDNACNRAAAVVLISHGRNILGAYQPEGGRAPLPTSAAELENTNADRFVVMAEPGSLFDDIVLPLTPDDLLAPLAAQGAIRNERALLQERARQVVTLMIGEVVTTRYDSGSGNGGCAGNACGYTMPVPNGTTTYTFQTGRFNTGANGCVAPYNTVGVATGVVSDVDDYGSAPWFAGDAGQVRDPWGRKFKFGRASQFITNLTDCPTPFVVISLGPDGTLGTADDYVYYSPLAEWKDILGRVGW
jgi:prepilin-type N-terminal cleavage/methylation domain-containing protein